MTLPNILLPSSKAKATAKREKLIELPMMCDKEPCKKGAVKIPINPWGVLGTRGKAN